MKNTFVYLDKLLKPNDHPKGVTINIVKCKVIFLVKAKKINDMV